MDRRRGAGRGQGRRQGDLGDLGVVALNPGQVPWGEVRLASPAKTGIAFKFETHTNTFTSLMVQLSPKIHYQVLPTTVDQPQVKTQVVITSS